MKPTIATALLLAILALVTLVTADYSYPNQPLRKKRDVSAPKPHEKCSHLFEGRQACTLYPLNIEGPYYYDERLYRSNITEGKPGIPLTINIQVINYTSCQPINNVVFDLWNCDVVGQYSGPGWNENDPDDYTSFRGYQVTNGTGHVSFQTIFPGWYAGRTIHIHLDAWVAHKKHIARFFFDEGLSQFVETLYPYTTNPNQRTKNDEDFEFTDYDGVDAILPLTLTADGFVGDIIMGFEDEPADVPQPTFPGGPTTTPSPSII